MASYVWIVQGIYSQRIGWEDLTACESQKEAREEKRTYDENEPVILHRVVRRREVDGRA